MALLWVHFSFKTRDKAEPSIVEEAIQKICRSASQMCERNKSEMSTDPHPQQDTALFLDFQKVIKLLSFAKVYSPNV